MLCPGRFILIVSVLLHLFTLDRPKPSPLFFLSKEDRQTWCVCMCSSHSTHAFVQTAIGRAPMSRFFSRGAAVDCIEKNDDHPPCPLAFRALVL